MRRFLKANRKIKPKILKRAFTQFYFLIYQRSIKPFRPLRNLDRDYSEQNVSRQI